MDFFHLAYTDYDALALRQEVEEMYQAEGLAMPPLAADLPALRRIGARSYATQALPGGATVYDVGTILDGVLSGEVTAPFAALGFDGHGFMTPAVHYHFATPQVAVLLQMRWGSIVDDAESALARYHIYMGWCRRLQLEAFAATVRGVFPEGWRAVAVQSDFTGQRWGWAPSQEAVTSEQIEWRQSALDPVFVVAQEIRNMLR